MRGAVALAMVCAGVGLAHAGGQIASPAIYGGYNQDRAACTIRNVGTSPMAIEADIYDESGNVVPPVQRSCNGTLVDPGRTCAVFVQPIANGVAFACSATFSNGSAKKVRGSLVLSAGFVPIRSTELR